MLVVMILLCYFQSVFGLRSYVEGMTLVSSGLRSDAVGKALVSSRLRSDVVGKALVSSGLRSDAVGKAQYVLIILLYGML